MASDQIEKPARATTKRGGRPRGVLGNRDFLVLWGGQTVSLIGTQVTQFTMPLVAVLTLNATVFEVGVLNALRFVPVLLFSLFAGVWLDRRRRRPVLIACALGNAVLIALVPIASAAGMLSIGLLYAVTALVGTLNMVFDVGALSYVPTLVEPRHLSDGNSKLQASNAIAGITGPGLAGLLIGLITAPITLSLDAASYLASALGLISIRRPEPPPDAPEAGYSVGRAIADGLREVFGSRLLRALATQSTALNLCFGSFTTIFVVYAVRHLGLTPFKLGLVMGAVAVGGLCGALTATRVRQRIGFGRALAATTTGVSAWPLLLLIPHGAGLTSMAVLIVGQLGYGFNMAMFNVNAITLRQVVTPRRLLARMNATYRLLIFGVPLIGAMCGGLLGTAVGLRTGLVISLVAMTSPLLWLFFSPVFRLKEIPTGPPSEVPVPPAT
jgi:MFS family permease